MHIYGCGRTSYSAAKSASSSMLTVTRSKGVPVDVLVSGSVTTFSRTGANTLQGWHQLSATAKTA